MADCISPKTLEIYWSSDGSSYTDLSGTFNRIEQPEQNRITGSVYNFSDDTACIGKGKREPVEVTFEIVYDDSATGAFQTLYPYFTNGSDIYLRWHPQGSGSGSSYTANGPLSNWVYPGGEAASGDPIVCGGRVFTDKIDVA